MNYHNNSPWFQSRSISRHFEPCHFQWRWPAWPHPSAAQDQTHQASSPGQLSTGGGDVAPGDCHWAMSCAVDVLVPFGLYQGMVKQPKNIPREWNPRKIYSIFYNIPEYSIIFYMEKPCVNIIYIYIYFWLTYNFWLTSLVPKLNTLVRPSTSPCSIRRSPAWWMSSKAVRRSGHWLPWFIDDIDDLPVKNGDVPWKS